MTSTWLHDLLEAELHRSRSAAKARGHDWDVADALAAVEAALDIAAPDPKADGD